MKAFQSFAFFLIFSIVECKEIQCTTPNIKEIILGRCNDYLNNILLSPTPIKYIGVKCTKVWETFYNGFTLQNDSYTEFFKLFESENLIDKALFWSNTQIIAHEYTSVNGNLYALANTLPGYLVNGLTWSDCTDETQPDDCTDRINYGKCDRYSRTSNLYWRLASEMFSNMAQGKAFVMLNGSLAFKDALADDSVFMKRELPIIKKKVKKLDVRVIYSLDKERKTYCKEAVEKIKKSVDSDNIEITCSMQPRDTLFLLCAKNPDSEECIMKSESKESLGKIKKARKVRKARKHDN